MGKAGRHVKILNKRPQPVQSGELALEWVGDPWEMGKCHTQLAGEKSDMFSPAPPLCSLPHRLHFCPRASTRHYPHLPFISQGVCGDETPSPPSQSLSSYELWKAFLKCRGFKLFQRRFQISLISPRTLGLRTFEVTVAWGRCAWEPGAERRPAAFHSAVSGTCEVAVLISTSRCCLCTSRVFRITTSVLKEYGPIEPTTGFKNFKGTTAVCFSVPAGLGAM